MTELVVTDPRFTKKERHHALDRFWLSKIRDERDLPFVHLALQMTILQLPLAVAVFVADGLDAPWFWWLAAGHLAVTFFGFVDRYILMLHNTSHRPLFKKKWGWLYHWFVWVLGPLNGETPETYYAHHVGMHHAEENLENDLSSTMRYRRDRLSHFLVYWGRFFFGIVFELSFYFFRKKNYKMVRRMLVGEVSFLIVLTIGLVFAWRPTLVVFAVPFVAVRFLMMAGNWAQHAFIDPEHPKDPYRSAIVCINSRYNRRCFNDGYHIGHHEMAARHWTDMPADFEKKRERYVERDAVVFQNIDYFIVWLFLMLKRYDWLSKHYVDLREEGERRSREEIEALLRERTLPIA